MWTCEYCETMNQDTSLDCVCCGKERPANRKEKQDNACQKEIPATGGTDQTARQRTEIRPAPEEQKTDKRRKLKKKMLISLTAYIGSLWMAVTLGKKTPPPQLVLSVIGVLAIVSFGVFVVDLIRFVIGKKH